MTQRQLVVAADDAQEILLLFPKADASRPLASAPLLVDALRALGGIASIRALARAVDAKDPKTRAHSERVAALAAALALVTGWDVRRAALLREAGLVHDIGKVALPDSILFKPGPLTDAEYRLVIAHAALGADMVAGALSPAQTAWVRGHHERFDGRGYPDGLSGWRIPVGARLLGLADAWDAMTVARPYGEPRSPANAMEECRRQAGAQFCPRAVRALEVLWRRGRLREPFTPRFGALPQALAG
jgi:HD-GYP domain-containing protein (c-di-GMP phosphodiesterase class II)